MRCARERNSIESAEKWAKKGMKVGLGFKRGRFDFIKPVRQHGSDRFDYYLWNYLGGSNF